MPRKRKGGMLRADLLNEDLEKKKLEEAQPKQPQEESCPPEPTISPSDDLDLVKNLEKMSITAPTLGQAPPPNVDNILNLMVFHEMLLNIPVSAHPSVKDFLKSKFLEVLQVEHTSTEEFLKFSTKITKQYIKKKLEDVSCHAEMSFSVIITPPVSCCIEVRTSLVYVFLLRDCFFNGLSNHEESDTTSHIMSN